MTFRSNRRPAFKRNNNFSNGRVRNKGNITQQYNKYLKLAKDAFTSGDRIQSEYYYQFTDHYYRLMLELGITLEDNETTQDNKISSDVNHENQISNENNNEKNDSEVNDFNETSDSDDVDSIESIPFMAEPAKKKSTKAKKASA